MSIVLTEEELVALTGYKLATMQLDVLRRRGFYRACIGRHGVVLTRAHYEAVEGGKDAEPAVGRKVANLSHLRPAT
jgi:hypothetical protein